LEVDEDGAGAGTATITINLDDVTFDADIAADMLTEGSIVVI
jgi:hypothetical protein